MAKQEKRKKNDHQIFDGGKPEFRNINERIFSALETDYEPLQEWETKQDVNLTTRSTDQVDVDRGDDEPPYTPL